MRRIISLLIVTLLLASILMLSGCSKDSAVVESMLVIDSDYKGHREITVKYPLSTNVEELSKKLQKDNPFINSKKSKFEYQGVGDDGYTFVMDIVFYSHEDYIDQVKSLVGRDVTSCMAQPDTIFTKGTRMVEDFSVADLIKWLTDAAKADENTETFEYDYAVNTVSINSKVFNTGATIDISQREGKPINSITIETTNLKDGTYDRTITFSIPNKTYTDLVSSIEEYFKTNTSPDAQYCDFSSRGTSWEYKVIYKGITIEQLELYTAMLLDEDNTSVFYGDKNNTSTPLSEGLVFEENLSTMSFMDHDANSIEIDYRYALPTKTTYGDGSVYASGTWKNQGSWSEGVYSVVADNDTLRVRIPDGIEYMINGIRFDLEVLGKDDFVRTTEFLYSKEQGKDGINYAKSFFESKGAVVETSEDKENLVCKVICKGGSKKITDELVKYFGSGNFVAYEVEDSFLSLSENTKLTDYINISHILNSVNANRPMSYTAHSLCAENINELSYEGAKIITDDTDSDGFTVDVVGGEGIVVYNGNIPNATSIVTLIVVCILILVVAVGVVFVVLRKRSNNKNNDNDLEIESYENHKSTFSLSKLFSDKTNKKLREEIDKDINAKIEADRIESKVKELKEKELEQLNRMVYGDSKGESSTDDDSKNEEQKD